MELRHLRYFLAVAEALNFTKAAALLRVAQPALSRRVQDLEDEIGVDLLKRSSRGVVLTAEGKVFLDKTRHILKLADESVEQVRALARGEEASRSLDARFTAGAFTTTDCETLSALLESQSKVVTVRKPASPAPPTRETPKSPSCR